MSFEVSRLVSAVTLSPLRAVVGCFVLGLSVSEAGALSNGRAAASARRGLLILDRWVFWR